MSMPPVARYGLAALVILVIGAIALRMVAARSSDLPEPRLAWDATVAAAEGDPARWMLFIAERQDSGPGDFAWRRMAEPPRVLWATARFELGLPTPPVTEDADGALPTYDEAADAYEAMGLDEAAKLVRAMHRARPTAGAKAGADWAAGSARLVAMKPRLAAARTAYSQAHRAEIDRIGAAR